MGPGIAGAPFLLVRQAWRTAKALAEAAVLISVILFLFLWNLRAALVVVSSIPLSILIAFIMMRWFGLSANLQSMGGLAIGIGMMVDGSVVQRAQRTLTIVVPACLGVIFLLLYLSFGSMRDGRAEARPGP